jgi:hypothetical protein
LADLVISREGAFAVVIENKQDALDFRFQRVFPNNRKDLAEKYEEFFGADTGSGMWSDDKMVKQSNKFYTKTKINGQSIGISIYRATINTNTNTINNDWIKL